MHHCQDAQRNSLERHFEAETLGKISSYIATCSRPREWVLSKTVSPLPEDCWSATQIQPSGRFMKFWWINVCVDERRAVVSSVLPNNWVSNALKKLAALNALSFPEWMPCACILTSSSPIWSVSTYKRFSVSIWHARISQKAEQASSTHALQKYLCSRHDSASLTSGIFNADKVTKDLLIVYSHNSAQYENLILVKWTKIRLWRLDCAHSFLAFGQRVQNDFCTEKFVL